MKERLVHLSLIAGAAALFYSNSFGNFFVWNDWTLIIENFLVKDWRNLPEIFTSAFWKPLLAEPSQTYRPLVLVSFMADFSLWGLKPWGYHLTNTSLHVLNSFLAYFLMRFYVSPAIALGGSLLFAVHPIQTEAVTYISGRGELLQALFLLSGAILFLRSRKQGSWILYPASLLPFLLATLSKETAVLFPLWLLAAEMACAARSVPGGLSRLAWRQIGPLAILALYVFWRSYYTGANFLAYDWSLGAIWQAFHATVRAVPLAVGMMLFPLNLRFLHAAPPPSLNDPLFLLGVVLLACVSWWLISAWKRDSRAVVFGLLWLFIGFVPVAYTAFVSLPFVESRLYLPSVGFFLLAGLYLARLEGLSSSRLHIWLLLLITTLLGSLTFYRNRDWKDDMTIAARTLQASPDNPTALRLQGQAHYRRAKTGEAEETFRKALLLAPQDPRLHESLGRLQSWLGRDDIALSAYHRMLELAPNEPYAYWRLGRFHLRRGNLAEAESYFERATRLFARSSEMHNDLASVYYRQGKLELARAELEAGLRFSPYSPVLRRNLEQVLRRKD